MRSWAEFRAREDGATAIEYALIVALIALALLGGLTAVGQALDETYGETRQALGGPAATPPVKGNGQGNNGQGNGNGGPNGANPGGGAGKGKGKGG